MQNLEKLSISMQTGAKTMQTRTMALKSARRTSSAGVLNCEQKELHHAANSACFTGETVRREIENDLFPQHLEKTQPVELQNLKPSSLCTSASSLADDWYKTPNAVPCEPGNDRWSRKNSNWHAHCLPQNWNAQPCVWSKQDSKDSIC